MKRFLSCFLLGAVLSLSVACVPMSTTAVTTVTETTTASTATETTTAETTTTVETTTTIETTTTETTVTTTEMTTTIDFSAIAVAATATNAAAQFADLSAAITAWSDGTTATISVDDLIAYEPYSGTGAALTYSAAWLIDNSPDRDAIIEYIFGTDGLHVQLIRLCVGTSDFTTAAMGHYTYDDTVGNVADTDLSEFSIAKDAIIIGILQDALAINPDIVFMAAPWSAPAWMKTNKSLYGGQLSSTYYNAYAQYLIKFLEAYRDEGIEIDYLSVQNEPYYAASDYPGMTWTVDTTKIFIRDFLGPQRDTAGLTAKIMIWDHNPVDNAGALIDFPVRVLRSAETAAYIGAIGIHCYTGDDADMYDFLEYLYTNAPDMEIFMTECTAVTTYTNLEQNMEWSIRRMYLEAFNRHASGTAYWNLVMDPNGATHLGGCSTCTGLVTVPVSGSGFETEADGYVTAHFAKYVALGARRIATRSFNTNVLVVGYLADDGQITLVVWNDGSARNVSVTWRGKKFTVLLPANSLTSIRWQKP